MLFYLLDSLLGDLPFASWASRSKGNRHGGGFLCVYNISVPGSNNIVIIWLLLPCEDSPQCTGRGAAADGTICAPRTPAGAAPRAAGHRPRRAPPSPPRRRGGGNGGDSGKGRERSRRRLPATRTWCGPGRRAPAASAAPPAAPTAYAGCVRQVRQRGAAYSKCGRPGDSGSGGTGEAGGDRAAGPHGHFPLLRGKAEGIGVVQPGVGVT